MKTKQVKCICGILCQVPESFFQNNILVEDVECNSCGKNLIFAGEEKNDKIDESKFGESLSKILVEIEHAIIEFDCFSNRKPNYSKNALKAALKIFMSVSMDRLFENQLQDKITISQASEQAYNFGIEMRGIIQKYLKVDPFHFYDTTKYN
jgi:hypothetical protein